MSRTITIDNVQVVHAQIAQDSGGDLRVYVVYNLISNGQVIQTLSKEITAQLSGTQKTQALALLSNVAQAVSAVEQV